MADQEWSQLEAICDLTAFRQVCNDSHSANMVHNWDLWCQEYKTVLLSQKLT